MNNIFVIILIVILIVFYFNINYTEKFSKTKNSNDVKIIVFTSNSCGHCTNYINDKESLIKKLANNNDYTYERHDANSSPDYPSDKQYVPLCVVIKDNKKKVLETNITPDNIENLISTF